jgi:hypothetical protein
MADQLVTIQEARAYVLRDENDDSQDVLLGLLIDGYTKAIQRYCDRQLFPEDGATKSFLYLPSLGRAAFSPYELRTATTLSVNEEAQVADDYSLRPLARSTEGTYFGVVLDRSVSYPEPSSGASSTLTIVGDWGTATVPQDAKLACLMSIYNAFSNPARHASRSLGPQSFSERADAHAIPQDARELLYQLKRLSV